MLKCVSNQELCLCIDRNEYEDNDTIRLIDGIVNIDHWKNIFGDRRAEQFATHQTLRYLHSWNDYGPVVCNILFHIAALRYK